MDVCVGIRVLPEEPFFLSVRSRLSCVLIRYRGKYRGLRFNFASAYTLHRSPQFIQGEVTIAGCHAHYRGGTPPCNLRNLRNRDSCIEHPGNRCVPQIVEAAGQRRGVARVLAFGIFFENLARPQLGRFPRFRDAPNGIRRVNVVCLGAEFVPARTVPLCRKHVMLRLALREVRGPKT